MKNLLIVYGISALLILAGLIGIREAFKRESFKSKMLKVNYVPVTSYGKTFLILFGCLCLVLGILMARLKIK